MTTPPAEARPHDALGDVQHDCKMARACLNRVASFGLDEGHDPEPGGHWESHSNEAAIGKSLYYLTCAVEALAIALLKETPDAR